MFKIILSLVLILAANFASAAPEISGFKAMKAPGEKFSSRIVKGLKQYLSQEELEPAFQDLENLPRKNLLQSLNIKVNDLIQYTPDDKLYGTADHWASFEDISKSLAGDCEDYALLKYWALRKLGVDPGSMHVLVFYDKIVRIHHAVLVVEKDGTDFILDNRTDKLIPLKKMTDILPNLAINESEVFIYGKIK